MRTPLLLAAGLLFVAATPCAPARAQGAPFQSLLSGKGAPLTRKLKEFTPQWRRINVMTQGDAGAGGMASGFIGAMFGGGAGFGGARPGYYTEGETVMVGGETYLVAYKTETKPLDVSTLMRLGQGGQLPPPEKLSAESVLHLTLLNVRHIAGITDIRAFDLDRELAESEKAAKEEADARAQLQGRFGGGVEAPPAVGEAIAVPDAAVPAAPEKPAKKPVAKPKAPAKKR